MTKATSGCKVHPTAIVESGAELGIGVEIGPYAVIGPRAKIGDRTKLHAHAQIMNRVTLGPDNEIFPGVILGGSPQDRTHHGEDAEVVIGARNQIREYCTVHVGTERENGLTQIGNDNLIMGGSHVAHDCQLGNWVTISNNTMIAGHVRIEDYASVSGGVGLHQWCTLGAYCYVGALARVAMDVPPYLIVEGRPGRVRGLNLLALKRNGLPEERLEVLRQAYKILFHTGTNRESALRTIETGEPMTVELQHLVTSLRRSERGFRGRYLEGLHRGYAPLDNGDEPDEGVRRTC